MPFSNKIAVLVNAPLFERELRKYFKRRCNYQELLNFLTAEDQENHFNREGRINDCVRAIYFCAQTVYRNNQFERRQSDSYNSFLGALRSMGYDVDSAYNSIDAHLTVQALELADLHMVDTVVLAGVTVDHVPMIWNMRSKGIKVMGFFAKVYDVSERIKDALNWYYQIKPDDKFLGEEVQMHNDDAPHEEESHSEETASRDA